MTTSARCPPPFPIEQLLFLNEEGGKNFSSLAEGNHTFTRQHLGGVFSIRHADYCNFW